MANEDDADDDADVNDDRQTKKKTENGRKSLNYGLEYVWQMMLFVLLFGIISIAVCIKCNQTVSEMDAKQEEEEKSSLPCTVYTQTWRFKSMKNILFIFITVFCIHLWTFLFSSLNGIRFAIIVVVVIVREQQQL